MPGASSWSFRAQDHKAITEHMNGLLRDYLAWEPRPLLRRRAAALLRGMESTLTEPRPVGT